MLEDENDQKLLAQIKKSQMNKLEYKICQEQNTLNIRERLKMTLRL